MGYSPTQQKRIADGFCVRCGKKRDVAKSRSCCGDCLQERRDAGRERYADWREKNPPFGPNTGRRPYRLGGAVKLGAVGAINVKMSLSSKRAVLTLLRQHWEDNGGIEPYRRSVVIRDAIKKMAQYCAAPPETNRGIEAEPSLRFMVDAETRAIIDRYMGRFGCSQSAAVRELLIAAARPRRAWVATGSSSDWWD